MIKVCYIIGQLGKGGAERQLYELVKGINREQFYPNVISLCPGGYWSEEIRKLDIQLIEIQRKKNMELMRLFNLIKLLKLIKPDIVHTYMFSANSYGRVAAFLARAPVVIVSERSFPDVGKDKTNTQIHIDKMLSLFSDGIICNSLKASDVLTAKYSFDASNVFTIHNGINAMAFDGRSVNSTPKKIARKVIGSVGSLSPVKNHKLFLDVAKIVLDSSTTDDIKFIIIGEGPLRKELEKYSQYLRIANNIVLTGERTDIPELLQGMDVFVMTSLYEGLSNAVMEAMSAGLPVVASDVGGNSELVMDGETGYLCPSGDVSAFADKIIFLLKNEDKAGCMGENGKRRIQSEFSVRKMVKQTEQIYLQLLRKKGYKSLISETSSRIAAAQEN